MEDIKTYVNLVDSFAKLYGISDAEIARDLGVSAVKWQNIRSGRHTPNLELVLRLIEWLKTHNLDKPALKKRKKDGRVCISFGVEENPRLSDVASAKKNKLVKALASGKGKVYIVTRGKRFEVVKLYPYFALCIDSAGIRECFRYEDIESVEGFEEVASVA